MLRGRVNVGVQRAEQEVDDGRQRDEGEGNSPGAQPPLLAAHAPAARLVQLEDVLDLVLTGRRHSVHGRRPEGARLRCL